MKAGDRGGEKAAAFLLPTGKLPPRAPEHATLNRQYLANRGKAGTSPAPGKRCCGRTLTHSPEPNHSSPSAFSVLEKQEEILGLKALAQTATNFDHKTKGGKKKTTWIFEQAYVQETWSHAGVAFSFSAGAHKLFAGKIRSRRLKGGAGGSGFRASFQGSRRLRESSATHHPSSPSPLPECAGATEGFLQTN